MTNSTQTFKNSIPGMDVSSTKAARPSNQIYIAKICEEIISFVPTAKDIYVHEGELIRVLSAGGMQPVTEVVKTDVVERFYSQPVTKEQIESFLEVFVEGASNQEFSKNELKEHIRSKKSLDRTILLGNGQRLRIALLYHSQGKSAVVIRVIPRSIEQLNIKTGLPPAVLERIQNPNGGFVIVCGPTGSGKTQLAMSIVDHYNRNQSGHIEMIEDPCEHLMTSQKCVITQRQVGIDVDSYAQGMIEAKRHNPSFVMAGEIRDSETAEAALNMSMSGAYMLATNHAMTIPSMLRAFVGYASSGKNSGNTETVYKMLSDSLAAVVRVALLNGKDGNSYYRVYDTLLNQGRARKFIETGNLTGIEELLAATNQTIDSHCTSMNDDLRNLVLSNKVDRAEAMAKTSNFPGLQVRLGGIK